MSAATRLILLTLVFGGLAADRCMGQLDPWEFEVYSYATEPRGMVELATDNAVVTSGHEVGGEGTSKGTFASERMWYNAYEVTYGLNDRLEAAAYLTVAQPNGGSLRRAGQKLRLRGRLFDEDTLWVNVGWYAELEGHRTPSFDDASSELELRPTFQKDVGRFSVMLNPKFEKILAGVGHRAGFEYGYAAGVQYRWTRRLSPGLEFYGSAGFIAHPDSWGEQQHYIFPTIFGELPGRLEYNAGVGYGLTRGSDLVIFKLNLELERFVGALFTRSSERLSF